MTRLREQPESPTSDEGVHLLGDLVAKYGTQAEAAKAWHVTQPTVSKLLRGKRGTGNSDALRSIAKAEGIDASRIVIGQPGLRVHEGSAGLGRFVYAIDDPHYMLKQVESWFADLPHETRMRRQVVRSVMRALLDESFSAIHAPSRDWMVVMQSVDGWNRSRSDQGGRTSNRR